MHKTLSAAAKTAAVCLLAAQIACGGGETTEDPWNKVQEILSESRDTVVLDGTEKAALKYAGTDEPRYGDWMVRHALSDPENFNPYTSSDQGATQVHTYVFESLLEPEYDPPYAQRGFIAADYPDVSDDKLTYTFRLRENVHFSDGVQLTADDVLFSMKVIQTPTVRAPHLRNYYSSIQDVKKLGEYEISFECRQPYILNDLFLGGFDILPRHFYDPDGLLDPVPIGSLIDGSWEAGEHADRVRQFGERFNQDFNRRMLGSGAYYVADWEDDVVTGQRVVLTRNENYWGRDVEGIPPAGHVDRVVFKIINQPGCRLHRTDQRQPRYPRNETPGIQGEELVSRFRRPVHEGHSVCGRIRLYRVEQRPPHIPGPSGTPGDDPPHRPGIHGA